MQQTLTNVSYETVYLSNISSQEIPGVYECMSSKQNALTATEKPTAPISSIHFSGTGCGLWAQTARAVTVATCG